MTDLGTLGGTTSLANGINNRNFEKLGTRHEELEGIGQSIDCVEGETDRERVLDPLARDAGSQHRAHVLGIYLMLTRELAQHSQRRPKRLLDGRGLEFGKRRVDFRFILIRPSRDRGVRLRSKLALVHLRDDGGH
jgi:hypothetical protein